MNDNFAPYFYRIGREQAFTGDDYTAAVELITRDRLVNAAKHAADIEGHARCFNSQWEELRDAFARITECADVAANLAGRPEHAAAIAEHALAYARYERRSAACGQRFPDGTGWRRWQGKAIVECDAIIGLTQR